LKNNRHVYRNRLEGFLPDASSVRQCVRFLFNWYFFYWTKENFQNSGYITKTQTPIVLYALHNILLLFFFFFYISRHRFALIYIFYWQTNSTCFPCDCHERDTFNPGCLPPTPNPTPEPTPKPTPK